MRYKLGFIGCGNMAQAIASGAIKQGVLGAQEIIASDPSGANRTVFDDWGCTTTADNRDVAGQAQQVLLAVKPQVFSSVAPDLSDIDTEKQLLISIMAGLSSQGIAREVGRPCRVIRVMPNTPAMVGAGMAGVASGEGTKPGDDALAKQLFSAVGKVVELEEPMIDAINAVSGSGPAYLFYLAEAMEHAAVELGLGEHARQIVAQTLMGSGKLLAESGEDPAELRRKVTSPGGTTLAASTHLDAKQVHSSIAEAIQAAFARAKELGAS
ncbi:MAG: pyrroline-5-carboxylate reductase [Phycisphaeraceae bacterium]|nr:pyrroline-5-carboxylate reductase [Phycisphaeraceae bacterium]